MRPPATAGAQFGDHPLAEEVDGPERVRPERWSEGEMRGSLFDERGAPVDDILGCAGDAEPEHGGRDEAERLRRVASLLGGRRRREVRSTQAHPLEQVRGELWPIKDELLRQGRSAPSRSSSTETQTQAGISTRPAGRWASSLPWTICPRATG